MRNTKIKYCRNCVWSGSGWCEWYQQELKPCAGKGLGFQTKHVKRKEGK